MAQKFNFKRLDEPFEADWPVKVSVPQDGGKTIIEQFAARFRIDRGEATAVPEELPSAPEAEEVVEGEEKLEAFRRQIRETSIREWRRWFVGFGAPTKDDTDLTDEVLWNMITTPYVRVAIQAAYKDFAEGVAAKN